MAEIKTKPGEVAVEHFLETLDAKRQEEADALIELMEDISGKPPIMWGTSIVGFDPFHYKSKSGQEGDWPRIGFSPRKGKISLYITFDAEGYLPLIEELGGKNSIGKGCFYIHKFEQVDTKKLHTLIERAYEDSFIEFPDPLKAM